MEKENIRPIDIKDFKDSQHTLDYIDNDFAIVNSLEGIPDNNDIVRLECFIIDEFFVIYKLLSLNVELLNL
ncbi:MAG: hypothetical protein E6834_01770, partial [Bacteroides ovatus]|nr:hypothetical protein [Bacteroides ovatus]